MRLFHLCTICVKKQLQGSTKKAGSALFLSLLPAKRKLLKAPQYRAVECVYRKEPSVTQSSALDSVKRLYKHLPYHLLCIFPMHLFFISILKYPACSCRCVFKSILSRYFLTDVCILLSQIFALNSKVVMEVRHFRFSLLFFFLQTHKTRSSFPK